MVTKTIYTDQYQVVIDIGAVPPTEEWLQETTYLIDNSGHTTAMIAQTDQPTNGVSLQPVPFTPANAQVSLVASPTRTPRLAPTASHVKSGNSDTIIALAAVGVILGVVTLAATLYLLRRRALRQRLRAQGGPLFSEDFATSGSSTSSNSIEKFFDKFKTSPGVKTALPTEEEAMPSWEAFLEEVERKNGNFDRNKTSSSEGIGSRINSTGRRENVAELKEIYKRLLDRHRGIRANVGAGANTWGALPATKVPASTQRETEGKFGAVAQPISILKRPGGSARKGLRLMDAVQGMLGIEDGKEVKVGFDESKKVTFGKAEIREFGRTPLPSSAGSMLSRNNAD